jgi:hypothetical protein
MSRTKCIWIVLIAIFVAFFSWYTSFKGPLTATEIEHYMARYELRQPTPSPRQLANFRKFMEEDTGDDFVMVNVIHLRDTPLQIQGVEPGESSQEVAGKYMEFMIPELYSRACHPVFQGMAVSDAFDIMNADGMETWTAGTGMRYRSRRDLLDIATNPEFSGKHEFKIAAIEKTIAFPVDPWYQLGDPRLVLAMLLGLIGCGWSLWDTRRS